MRKEIKYETKHYKFRFYDGIFHLTYLQGPIDITLAKEIVQKRLEVTEGKGVVVLVDDLGLKSVDRNARDYFSSDEGVKGILAGAFFVRSVFGMYLANFFLKISLNKAKFPTKVFSDEQEAIIWLKTFYE